MRPIEQDGTWGQKSYNINGRKIPAIDWNEQTKAEEWRKAWADMQNEYLQKSGINKNVDHRSFKRQGKEQIPTKHLGHSAFQMEKRGIRTVRGDWNRYAAITNSELRQLNGRIKKAKNELYKLPLVGAPSMIDVAKNIGAWRNTESRYNKIQKLKESAKVLIFLQENNITDISDVVKKSEELHKAVCEHAELVRSQNRRIDTLTTHLAEYETYIKNRSLAKKYNDLPEKRRDAYYEKYKTQLEDYKAATDYLIKVMNGKGNPPIKAWEKELSERLKLRWNLCDIYYNIRNEIKAVENIRWTIDYLMADVHVERERKQQHQKLSEIEL